MSRRSAWYAVAVALRLAWPAVALLFAWPAVALLLAWPAVAFGNGSSRPTHAQIKAAVARAERSRNLWATINICNPRRHRGLLGVRGQIPALGFASSMSVRIQVEYRSGDRFVLDPNPGTTKVVALSSAAAGLHQGGWSFPFGPHAGLLRGIATFEWKLDGKVIGRVTRTTTGHHKHVAEGDPPGHSAATCRIP